MKKKHLDIRMTDDELMWFAQYAEKNNRTMSEIIRAFINRLKGKDKEYWVKKGV